MTGSLSAAFVKMAEMGVFRSHRATCESQVGVVSPTSPPRELSREQNKACFY